MVDVVVRGAGGRAGRAAIARLHALGHTAAAEVDAPTGGGVVLDLAPPGTGGRAARREAWASALASGRHVVAASLAADDLAWAREVWDREARERGLVLLPTAGQAAVLGDALAALAGPACRGTADGPDEVHTAHLVLERGGLLRAASAGLRAEVAALVGSPTMVVEGGSVEVEPLAERRRLAWFARPVGPHHAATVPAPEVLTIADHQPTARTIAGHLAMATWQAELLQAVGNVVDRPRVGGWLRDRVASPGRRPVEDDARWAIVAEARGAGGVGRAWANGRDPSAATGEVAARLVHAVLAGGAAGVPAPSTLVDPADLLDALADDDVLRWAVVRPD